MYVSATIDQFYYDESLFTTQSHCRSHSVQSHHNIKKIGALSNAWPNTDGWWRRSIGILDTRGRPSKLLRHLSEVPVYNTVYDASDEAHAEWHPGCDKRPAVVPVTWSASRSVVILCFVDTKHHRVTNKHEHSCSKTLETIIKTFIFALLTVRKINLIWINWSEMYRYLILQVWNKSP